MHFLVGHECGHEERVIMVKDYVDIITIIKAYWRMIEAVPESKKHENAVTRK